MSDDPRVRRLLDELLESGSTPEQVCASCPELLAEVRRRWRRIRRLSSDLDGFFPARDEEPPGGTELPQVPGYEVQGVLGRGGMGIVFRARHLRLNRPVALKMILSGTLATPSQRQRFLREAEAIAAISHPNIVQVHNAGESEGRPWFTMELVEGGNLAHKIDGAPQPIKSSAALMASIAEAVAVAHRHDIVHRDLTPANILLTSDGTPKVTDFGLARFRDDAGATLTGSPFGTPSYMSPEQARGVPHEIGPATDVYALGAILYELLTGRPPFRGETSAATIQQLLTQDVAPPSQLNPRVPRDLATICLKCLHREPGRRYASAADLAEDLRRFLRGEPVAARRAGRLERLTRWARRSPAAAALLAVTLLLSTSVLGTGSWMIGRQVRTARAVKADLREADLLLRQSALAQAGAVLGRARSRLGDGGPFWLYPEVEAARRDHQFLARLEAIRVNRFTLAEGGQTHAAQMRFNKARADRGYADAFRGQGLGQVGNDPDEAAARVRAFKWAAPLVAALDDWAVCAADPARQDWVLGVARRADPDPWRDRVRDPAAWRDGKALAELARAAPPAGQPVSLLLALGERLTAWEEDGVGFLRRVQKQHPNDFWASFSLALALHGPARYPGGNSAPALVHYERALKIRPHTVAVLNNLGVGLMDMGWMWDNSRDGGGPGAYTVLYRTVKSDAAFAPGFNNLGLALKAKGDWGLSVLLFEDALRSDPHLAPAHFNLGEIRAGSGYLDDAIEHYRRALAVDADFGLVHCYLGFALLAKGRQDEVDESYPDGVKALERFRGQALSEASKYYMQAFGADPAWVPAHNPLHIPPRDEARLNEAIDHFRHAVRFAPEFPQTHAALGQALLARRQFAEAEAEIRRGLDSLAGWQKDRRLNLDRLLQRCQRLRALESRLSAVVHGTDKPAPADCLDLAELCFVNKHYATSARLYAEALSVAPQLTEDLRGGHRFNAARAAALASGGQADDAAGLGEPERQALRKQAQEGLRLDLAACAKTVDTGTAADRIQARKTLALWRDDPDLARLRDPHALESLPPAEAGEWRALWADVEAKLKAAAPPGAGPL